MQSNAIATRTCANRPAVERACADLQWLVQHEARCVARRVPYIIEIDDLIGAGAIGLVAAVQRHIDRPRPVLKRLAQKRIRGAILDYMRVNDYLTRRQRTAVNLLKKHTERLTRETGTAERGALAKALGIPPNRVERIQNQLATVRVTQLQLEDTERIPTGEDDPSGVAMRGETKAHLIAALATLPEKIQTLLNLYYYENLSYREIGLVLGVTDSRVCQLHAQAMQMLRKQLAHLG